MKNDSNKNAIVPPGAQPGRPKDQAPMTPVDESVQPDGKRMCPCCRAIVPPENYIVLLRKCIECANNCDGENVCQQNKCKCPGNCCAEHKAGEKCGDKIELVIGRIGEAVIEVCVACAIELAKKTLAL